jgi:predicted nucleic acid-binding protein
MGASVVDASALAAVIFLEPAAAELVDQLQSATLVAPVLIEYELGNICWKKCRRYPQQASDLHKMYEKFASLSIQLHPVDRPQTLSLALKHNITYYDATYLWLSQRLGIPLISLDDELNRVARQH